VSFPPPRFALWRTGHSTALQLLRALFRKNLQFFRLRLKIGWRLGVVGWKAAPLLRGAEILRAMPEKFGGVMLPTSLNLEQNKWQK
ncbi:MAG: hypothetical protein FD128_2277, partial [Hyphomonadaceae bacterium]